MKKFCLSIIAVAGLIAAPFTFADTQSTGGYTSGQVNLVNTAKVSKPGLAAAVAMTGIPATNIIIINFSDYYLHARMFFDSICVSMLRLSDNAARIIFLAIDSLFSTNSLGSGTCNNDCWFL